MELLGKYHYFKVRENYVMRGWDLLPFALVNQKKKEFDFFTREEFWTVLWCDGNTDFSEKLLTDKQKEVLSVLWERGVIEPCEPGAALKVHQLYKRYPSRFIKTVQWSITGRCNYRCRHCFMSAPEGKLGQLPFADCAKIIDEMEKCGITDISLTGGEPLIRKDFWQIVDLLQEKGIEVSGLYTNGKLLDEALLDEFEKRGLRPVIHMSFDGVGWHDWLRGIPGAEKYVLDACKLCQKRGFGTTAEMCLHKGNKDTLRETVRLLASLGVDSLKVNLAVPMGAWLSEADQYGMTEEEGYQIYLDYLPDYYRDGMPINLMLEGFFSADAGKPEYAIPNEKYEAGCDCSRKSICGHARNSLYISPAGIALPCMPLAGTHVEGEFPNILEKGLQDILRDSFYMKMVNVRLEEYLEHNPECRQCEYKERCGGGCRGCAIGEEGTDYLAIDRKVCEFYKKGYPQRIRETVAKAQKQWMK